ncbi:hypothetical protein G6F46_009464 [Rhizopus delemar]|uniref:Reverse transcriptase domain-containing protein n=2 Tax=Rhizopus TaxID=4842 RepID=A0A9P7CUK2_9FUNG|nr:hypothetical protein G6F55_003139 [Rhizopus delemar]KAG1546817.1 hypothetical protein G6F51_004644 [Rhizopus arrhizus]KAG1489920.1 hypothetical protein G6F54_011097 [Rhizopus delemar]KAG1507627.1 hypothetical protein G6F53_008806 [Rhizopus delemar]KAG1575889.1 hypothetical protein G6F50_000680 [Rhizopus delemar]
MDYINHTNGQDEESNQQTIFTRAEVEEIIRELEERREHQRQLQTIGSELPLAISQALDGTSTTQLKDNFKQYKRSVQRYNHDEWTTAEQINKEFIPELKNWKVDAYQLVHAIYKITETTRIQARASTELYEQLSYLQDKTEFASTKDRDIFNNTIEQAQRLAVYDFGSAKFQENDAKEVAIKALKLPTSIKHLEYSTEDDGKKNSFDGDFVERLQRARFEDKVIRDASSFRGGFHSNRSFNNGYRGRGGSRGGSWRGNWSHGQSFQTGGRGRANRFNIQRQQIIQQHPSSPVISTKQQQQTQQVVQYHNKNFTSNQHYAVPQDGILPGGRLTHFYNYWTQITSHQCPLSIVKEGYKIQFASHPTPWKLKSSNINPADQQAVNEAVNKFLSAGIIEIMPTQSEKYLSKFFTIQESTKRRPILDCQRLNQHIQCEHFKMEGVPALRELIEKGDFMCKIDLKDAYTVVPIHPESRQYLTFKNEGKIYQYRSLAFGLNVAPRLFSKLMRYAIEPLRYQGIRLVYYLDNICLLIPIQHKEDEDYSTSTQDQQPSTKDQTSVTANQEVLQVDCSSTGESYINDPSDRRSTPSYSSSSTRSSKEPTTEQSELGKTMPDISTKSARVSMVEEINNNEERPTDSAGE